VNSLILFDRDLSFDFLREELRGVIDNRNFLRKWGYDVGVEEGFIISYSFRSIQIY